MSKMSRIKSAFAKLKHIKLRWLLLAASIVVLSLVIAFLLQGREKTPIIVSDISILLDVSEGYFNSFKFGSEIHSIKVKEVGEGYAIFEVRSDPLLVRVNIGVDERIDVNGDGVLDVYLRVSKIDGKKVTFSIVKVVEEPTSLESGRYETPSKELKPVDSKRSIVEKIKIVSRGGGGGGGGGGGDGIVQPVVCKSDNDASPLGKENVKGTCEDTSGVKEDACVEEVVNQEGVGAAISLIEGFVSKITGQAIDDIISVSGKQYKSVASSSFVLEYACESNSCEPSAVSCANGCEDGVCKSQEQIAPQTICNAGNKQCEGNVLKTCSVDGLSWSEANCDDSNACTADACDGVEGCKHTPIVCDDGLFCNGQETCDPFNGCKPGQPIPLSDNLDCTADSCDETQDAIIRTPDNTKCGDGNLCNGAETCDVIAGCKSGFPLFCGDNNACTTDSCNALTGCTNKLITCDDGDACTLDSCDKDKGCAHATINCDDSLFCNGQEHCDSLFGCQPGDAPIIGDGVACTTDSCDEASDKIVHKVSHDICSDSNVCNGAEVCTLTGCQLGTPVNCDDSNSCTDDACNSITGCSNIATRCNDDNACTVDNCGALTGCSHSPISCDDNNACTVDTCDSTVGCKYAPIVCDDGLFCNGQETCDYFNGCQPGSTPTISDGVICTADSCDELQDKIIHATNDALCNNNDICDGVEMCNAGLGCQSGTTLSCSDNNMCTTDSCDSLTGCTHETISCDDNNLCTTDTCDAVSGCKNTPKNCDYGCNPATGLCQCPPAPNDCNSDDEFGSSECINENTYHACSKNSDGCFVWGPGVECSHSCNNGVCESEEIGSAKLIKVLVIPFTTSDVPMPSYVTQQWLSDMMFLPDAPHDSLNKPNSLRNYMEQVSYGKFTIDGEVTPIVTLPQTFDYYKNQPDTSPYNEGWMLMKKDVVEMADLIIDFKQFDGDRNGEVDMIVFLMPQGVNHPTYEDGIMQRILGVRGDSAGGFYYVDANGVLNNYGNDENVPMFSHIYIGLDYHPDGPFIPTFGILTHEFMHIAPVRWYGKSYSTILSNLQSNLISDLYDMPYENVGDYELMSTGGHRKTLCATKSGFGAYSSFSTCSAPTHFSGYTKMKLGFLVPHTLLYNSDETVRLYKTEESPPYTENIKLIKLPAASNNFNDFYLLELRTNKQFESGHNFDVGLGYEFFNPGLVVYHSIDRAADAIGVGVNFVTGGPINELYVIDATPGDPEQIYAGAAFGFSTEMSYTTPEGIRIEIISMHESRDYVDVKITYPCGDGYNKVCLPEQPSACNVGWQCVDADTKVYHFADCSKGGTTDCPINCENGVCKSCTDSDSDGYNFQQSYNIQGITMGKDQSNPNSIKTATDQCETVTLLTEYFCYNNFVLKDLHTCPNGCQDGACKVSL